MKIDAKPEINMLLARSINTSYS